MDEVLLRRLVGFVRRVQHADLLPVELRDEAARLMAEVEADAANVTPQTIAMTRGRLQQALLDAPIAGRAWWNAQLRTVWLQGDGIGIKAELHQRLAALAMAVPGVVTVTMANTEIPTDPAWEYMGAFG